MDARDPQNSLEPSRESARREILRLAERVRELEGIGAQLGEAVHELDGIHLKRIAALEEENRRLREDLQQVKAAIEPASYMDLAALQSRLQDAWELLRHHPA